MNCLDVIVGPEKRRATYCRPTIINAGYRTPRRCLDSRGAGKAPVFMKDVVDVRAGLEQAGTLDKLVIRHTVLSQRRAVWAEDPVRCIEQLFSSSGNA